MHSAGGAAGNWILEIPRNQCFRYQISIFSTERMTTFTKWCIVQHKNKWISSKLVSSSTQHGSLNISVCACHFAAAQGPVLFIIYYIIPGLPVSGTGKFQLFAWSNNSITTNKASEGGGFPAELFKILKDDAVNVLHSICQQIWKIKQWLQDWKKSVFISIPNKGNAKECSNYHAISLIAKLAS